MDFWQRLASFYYAAYSHFVMRPTQFSRHQEVFSRHFGPSFPPIAEVVRNVSLLFVNSNEFLELPHTSTAKIVRIGGIGAEAGERLSRRFELILDNAPAG